MQMEQSNRLTQVSYFVVMAVFVLSGLAVFQTVFGASSTVSVSTQVVVGNSAPQVSAVVLNGGVSPIVLTPNATTAVTVSFTIQDANGCNDVIVNGNTTSTIYRSGIGSACSASNSSCYIQSTTTSNCSANASTTNATTTFFVYYFADSTDGNSSTYPSEDWVAHIAVRDAAGASSTATSTHREMGVLTAIEVTTSSIDYDTLSAGTDTGGTNETATTTNAGNSTTTLRLHAVSTLTSGANSIATSSQEYSTSSFTFGAGVDLTDSAVTVGGFSLAIPTSTTAVARATFWGLEVPGGTPTGTYSGTTRFTSLWQP